MHASEPRQSVAILMLVIESSAVLFCSCKRVKAAVQVSTVHAALQNTGQCVCKSCGLPPQQGSIVRAAAPKTLAPTPTTLAPARKSCGLPPAPARTKPPKKTAAPSIPMWSPTIVLTRPALAYLRRSDGMRSVQVCMAAALVCVCTLHLCVCVQSPTHAAATAKQACTGKTDSCQAGYAHSVHTGTKHLFI